MHFCVRQVEFAYLNWDPSVRTEGSKYSGWRRCNTYAEPHLLDAKVFIRAAWIVRGGQDEATIGLAAVPVAYDGRHSRRGQQAAFTNPHLHSGGWLASLVSCDPCAAVAATHEKHRRCCCVLPAHWLMLLSSHVPPLRSHQLPATVQQAASRQGMTADALCKVAQQSAGAATLRPFPKAAADQSHERWLLAALLSTDCPHALRCRASAGL